MSRNHILTAVACIALAAAPSFAQGRSGGGGGPGGGMGGGPPISPPGQGGGAGASDAAREIASQRGQFGRDFAAGQRATAEQRRAQAEQYKVAAQQRRADAQAYAAAARAGRPLPANADRDIRDALKQDMQSWREAFSVGRSDWQAMRDQWIVDRKTLSPADWAMRRAEWFTARDAWIATHKDWAMARSN